jgi:hypothetical protein
MASVSLGAEQATIGEPGGIVSVNTEHRAKSGNC